MYPLKFKKHLVEKVWGGRKFEEILNIPLAADTKYGESWEVSSHKNGMSYVENGEFSGQSFQELLEKYKEELVGEKVYNKYGDKFPLLIKYLDINDKLSVQVHPDDEYALRVEGEFGKSETWYVIDASPDATLIMGTKENINRENFLDKFKEGKFEEIFNVVSVKKGDFIDVKPGIVHASLTGSILICETQQNSDTTYRIYDFDRLVDGALRPLHLEKAVEVIDFKAVPAVSALEERKTEELEGCKKSKLVKNNYFGIEELNIKGSYRDDISREFKVYSVIEGNGKMLCNGVEYSIGMGDTYFIPANLEIELSGELMILKSY